MMIADISAYDWEATLAPAEHRNCSAYATELFQKSAQLAQVGDPKGERVFRFLGSVAFLSLTPEDDETPFKPAIQMQNRRSSAVEDFSMSDLDTLAALIPITKDAGMRARIADIIWVTRKDHKAAKAAADAYLENFNQIPLEKDWMWGMESLRRGFNLAGVLGRKREPFPSYVALCDRIIADRAARETEALSGRLMDLLLEHEAGDFPGHAARAEGVAKNVESTGNAYLAQQYLELAMGLHMAAKNEEGARQARLEKGESLVRRGHAVIDRPGQGYIAGSHFLAMGIECLRQARAPEARIKEFHKKLLEWQQNSLNEMKTFTVQTDISEAVEGARNYLRGKSLQDAVLSFALGHPLLELAKLKQRVIENAGRFPLSHLLGATFMSHDGRVLAHKPPVIALGKTTEDLAVEAEMISQARTTDWPLRVTAYIEPCRFEIYQEHRPSQRDLAFLVEHNPFIPPGHQGLFLRGIHAGFHGDMVLCAHVLIPQIEEAIRYVLRQSGVVTSKLDSKLVQEERLLGTLLSMPEAIEIFGDDAVFELRGILCEKFGFDLRNRLAHGFLTMPECYGQDVLLVWWLALRLCAFPVYRALSEQAATENPSAAAPHATS